MTIQFHRLAAEEFRKVRRWYFVRNSAVSIRFTQAVETAIDRMVADPTSHPIEIQQIRWVRVKRFPYRLIFECLDGGTVQILAVAHTSRRQRLATP